MKDQIAELRLTYFVVISYFPDLVIFSLAIWSVIFQALHLAVLHL